MCIRDRLETLFYIDFTPDIINCNDWQTALVPVYLNLYYCLLYTSDAADE